MNEDAALDISVVVPTFNRARGLARLLDDLCGQTTGRNYEVIVVDNASTDDTAAVVHAFSARNRRVTYVREPVPGASNARNRGIAAARAPILAFVDDDVRVAPDWIESICCAFERDPTLDCVGGRVAPRWPEPPPRWLTPAHWGPLALQVDRGRSTYLDRDHASACLITANFACRASVFREIGGFSPSFQRDEDRELNLRMWRAGKRGRYEDSVVACAEVQPERLRKDHHRRWHGVTGRSHARLRYREVIDRTGALCEELPSRGVHAFGVPGFLYRDLLGHLVAWAALMVRGRIDDAFVHECRARYFAAYVWTRLTRSAG